MRNLLKEEFYKSTRGVTQYICGGFAFLALLSSGMGYLSLIETGMVAYGWQTHMATSIFNMNISEIVLALVIVYICGEFARGSIKTYREVGISREKIFWGKLIKTATISFGIVVSAQLLNMLLLPFEMQAGSLLSFGQGIVVFLYSMLCLIECICFYVGMAFLVRNIGAVIGIHFGIVLLYAYSMLFVAPGSFMAINTFFNYTYMPLQSLNATTIVHDSTSTLEIVLMILFPVIISILSLAAGYFNFKKLDLK